MSANSRAVSGWVTTMAGGLLLLYAFLSAGNAFYALFDVGMFLLVTGPLIAYSSNQLQSNRATDRLKFAKLYSSSDSDHS